MKNKYFLHLVKNYQDDQEARLADSAWEKIVLTAKSLLNVNKCKLYVFNIESCLANIAEKLKECEFQIEQDKFGGFFYILNIEDFIRINTQFNIGLYNQYFEDPELLHDSEKIIDTISHEYYITFYLSNEEKNMIEMELKVKLTPANSQ